MNCGLLGGGCASVDTDVISHRVCLLVLAKTLVRWDKSTSSRESFRENGRVKTRTLANLSRWPENKVNRLDRALKGLPPADWDLAEAFEITRSLPHGHVAAVAGTAAKLGMPELIDPTPSRNRDLVLAMLIGQVIAPGSKLAIARGLRAQTATSTLGQMLDVSGCDEDDLYAAMDWALARKDAIENALAARHLANGTLVLYDVSSAAFEGRVRSAKVESNPGKHESCPNRVIFREDARVAIRQGHAALTRVRRARDCDVWSRSGYGRGNREGNLPPPH